MILDPISLPNADTGARMNSVLQPWQLLVVILTGWLNRQQQAVIDFLLTEDLFDRTGYHVDVQSRDPSFIR